MTVWTVVALVVGVVLLVVGAEALVKGASSIASRLGIAPVVIGLTVVAFGTSAPELAVSALAGIGGRDDVAFGNVVGSNIANVLLILGMSAVIGTLAVTQRIVRLDVPLVIVASFAVLVLALDNRIGHIEGAALFAGVLAYTWWLIRSARRETPEVAEEYAQNIEEVESLVVRRPLVVQVALVVVGLAILIAGSRLLVGGAVDMAAALGVSDLVIGLTVVAVGTSLPELATSVLAAIRGERDIAVGNVVGSNLFNLLSVLGLTAVVTPGGVAVADASLRLDVPVMLAATVVLLPIIWNGFVIQRWEGAVLVACYAAYVSYLVLAAVDHEVAPVLGVASLLVTTLIGLGLAVSGYQGWRRYRAGQAAQAASGALSEDTPGPPARR
jgi:cation:H+ antiporter